ncbi:MAG: hypothetical protein E7508_02045 [Ruminococcus sp.]|nr:hypothetical protein [Ruminococcus sp.]
MKVLSIIFGVLMAILGISLTFTPLMTYLSSGYYLAIMLSVYGIIGIINGITKKEFKLNFVFAVLSVIAGILLIALPGFVVLTDAALVYCMAVWFIIEGAVGIVNSVQLKKANDKKWGWILAFGIIGLIVGVYSLFHPILTAFALGVLIGIYFIQAGLNLVLAAFVDKD